MTTGAAVPRPNTAKPAHDLKRVDNANTDCLVEEEGDLIGRFDDLFAEECGRRRSGMHLRPGETLSWSVKVKCREVHIPFHGF